MKLDQATFERVRADNHKDQEVAERYRKNFKKKYHPIYFFVCLIWWSLFIYFCFQHSSYLWQMFKNARDPISASFGLLLIFFVPVIVYNFLAARKFFELDPEGELLKKVAEDNNGFFSTQGTNLNEEKAALFRLGNKRYSKKLLRFHENGNDIRFFSYNVEFNAGRQKKVFRYHVLGIKTAALFPHMYLNYKKNSNSMSLGTPLSLPALFEKDFTLSIPRGYQLEALQVFTPDVLAAIIDLPFKCDIEFVGDEILFLLEDIKDIFYDYEEFVRQIRGSEQLAKLLVPKMKDIRWVPVGDLSYHL